MLHPTQAKNLGKHLELSERRTASTRKKRRGKWVIRKFACMKHKAARARKIEATIHNKTSSCSARSMFAQQLPTQVLRPSDCRKSNENEHPESLHVDTASISIVIAAGVKE